MQVSPKDQVKETLELAIAVAVDSGMKTFNFQFNSPAKLKILIATKGKNHLKSQFLGYDEVHLLNSPFNYEEAAAIIRNRIKNPKLTRIGMLSDLSFEQVARMREEFGIPGPTMEDYLPFVSKDLQKKIAIAGGVRVPKSINFSHEMYLKDKEDYRKFVEEEIGYPIFCKKDRSRASLGTIKVTNREELMDAFEEMAKTSELYGIEEFIQGDLYGLDMAIINDEIKFFNCARKGYPCIYFYKGKPNSGIMLKPSSVIFQRMLKFAKQVVKAFSPLYDNWCNLECFLSDKDEIVFCEINYRRTGSYILPNIVNQCGVNGEAVSLDLQWGSPVRLPVDDFKTDYDLYGFYADYPRADGKIKEKAKLPKDITSRANVCWFFKDGVVTKKASGFTDDCAYALVTNSNWEELSQDFEKFIEWHPYVYE